MQRLHTALFRPFGRTEFFENKIAIYYSWAITTKEDPWEMLNRNKNCERNNTMPSSGIFFVILSFEKSHRFLFSLSAEAEGYVSDFLD